MNKILNFITILLVVTTIVLGSWFQVVRSERKDLQIEIQILKEENAKNQ